MKKIIVIDNEEKIGHAIRDYLIPNYEVTTYTDKKILNALMDIFIRYANDNCYDLAIFDCLMAVNGVIIADFIRTIEKSGITKNKMPIVFFTAYDGLFPGLENYTIWTKPDDVKNLNKLVDGMLRK